MPLDRVDQLPLPSLHWYAGFSALAVFYAGVYALTTPEGLIHTLQADMWCAASVLNMACCCFFLLTSFIYSVVFGKLQRIEQQHMRDKFWNFVFYKFIFVFGVMNVQEAQGMLCWCLWFAVLGTLLLTEQLSKDRFQILSFSPNTPTSAHAKIIILVVMVILSCAGLFMVCAIVGWQYGFNHFSFLYSEVFILLARALHTLIRYIIHLWDMQHDGTWENRNTYTYYAELVLELAALSVDFMHHIHMLLWANMFLSVASLILLMNLRFLYQEIQRRLKRHRSYIRVTKTLEKRFMLVSKEELSSLDETCAICWEKLTLSASRLPCGHLFHMGCLRLWLEQDAVCPTCRRSLIQDLAHSPSDGDGGEGGEDGDGEGGEDGGDVRAVRARGVVQNGQRRARPRRMAAPHRDRNWLLHFNGASIASWLPTFSLELHQDEHHWLANNAAELHRGAQQLHSMFPDTPLHAITLDLADTRSVALTVERILNNAIYIPGQELEQQQPPPSPLTQQSQHSTTGLPSPLPLQSMAQLPSNPSQHSTASSERDAQPPSQNLSVAGLRDGGARSDTGSQAAASTRAEVSGLNLQSFGSSSSGLRHRGVAGSGLDVSVVGGSGGEESSSSQRILSPLGGTSVTTSSAVDVNVSQAVSFASLQQRKEELLKRARREYLLKHHPQADYCS